MNLASFRVWLAFSAAADSTTFAEVPIVNSTDAITLYLWASGYMVRFWWRALGFPPQDS